MDQEKIGKFILDIRKKNNLTQREFADKFGVTYQAVSKWENGKNIPDISILKMICEEFDVELNEILDVKTTNRNNSDGNSLLKSIIIVCIFLVIVLLVFFTQFNYSKGKGFEFKTLEASCDNFNISGSIAYNDLKSSIYISNVEYCGKKDDTKFKKIECNLYEIEKSKSIKIGSCGYDIKDDITLDDYLKEVKFNINNYSSVCKDYTESRLQLEIDATDEDNNVISYKIPLKLNDNCK